MIDIYKILEKYAPDKDIFSDEEELITRIKDIVYNQLDEVDRRVLLMYAELASLRKLGKEIGVSASAAGQRIRQIKNKIYALLASS